MALQQTALWQSALWQCRFGVLIMKNHEVKTVERRFLIAILLTASILVVEVVGSWWTGSLALHSDAAHVFLDIFALVLSWLAFRLSTLPADERYSYGFHRFEVVASLANGLTLGFVSLGILVEAYHRLLEPAPVKGLDLLLLASVGLTVNLIVAFVLNGGHHHDQDSHAPEDLNVKIGDATCARRCSRILRGNSSCPYHLENRLDYGGPHCEHCHQPHNLRQLLSLDEGLLPHHDGRRSQLP